MSDQDRTATFLRSIGCEAEAGDVASLQLAERVIEAERGRVAAWLRRRLPVSRIPDRIEAGEHE